MTDDTHTDHGTPLPGSTAQHGARLTLALLGSPQVLLSGEDAIGPRADKALLLLSYLAIESHRSHRRSALASLFWPDRPREQALQDLRQGVPFGVA